MSIPKAPNQWPPDSFVFARRIVRSAITLVIAGLLGSVLLLTPASSHDPVTTTVTFNKEIVRILQKNCAPCHAPGQIKGDIPLTTFEEARPWAKAIKEEVLEKRMPPYQAVKGFGDFSNDYLLTQREVELLVSWIEGGAPKGEASDYPKDFNDPGRQETWKIGKPDLILQSSAPVAIPAGEGELEINLRLPTGTGIPQWISGLEFKPSNGAIVKRAEFFQVGACRGRNCPTPSVSDKMLEWVPGQTPVQLRSAYAIRLKPGAEILARIIYLRSEQASKDHSQLGVTFSRDQVLSQVGRIPIAVSGVPALAGRETRIVAFTRLESERELLGIRPLLFPLSRSVELIVYRPDGSVEIAGAARNYNTAWEPSYFFKKPIKVPAGSRIEAVAYVQNNDDNRNLEAPIKGLIFNGTVAELVLAERISK